MNLQHIPTAVVMSGRVATDKYMSEPTALRYGISFISCNSSGVEGQ